MKKYISITVFLFLLVFVVVFRREIMSELGQIGLIRNISYKIVGMEPADEKVADSGTGYYAYGTLNDEEKLVYNQIADCLLNYKTEVTISTRDEQIADQAFRCLINDHPEIYWVNSYEMTAYNISGITSQYSFKPVYTMSEEEAARYHTSIEQAVLQCLNGIPDSSDQYSVIKYLYDYIVLHTDYNKDAENDQNICSVFVNGQSVCTGYSKAFQYLLQRAGIQAVMVSGDSFGEAHAWNMVKLDNEYYYFDVTWGDPQFSTSGQVKDDYVDYGFFGMTTEELLMNHTIENAFVLPECTSDSYNYYKREGLYLESFDENAIGTMLERQFATKSFATIRCADEEVYQELYKYLIVKNHVWKYVEQNNTTYSEDEQYHILTIFKE